MDALCLTYLMNDDMTFKPKIHTIYISTPGDYSVADNAVLVVRKRVSFLFT